MLHEEVVVVFVVDRPLSRFCHGLLREQAVVGALLLVSLVLVQPLLLRQPQRLDVRLLGQRLGLDPRDLLGLVVDLNLLLGLVEPVDDGVITRGDVDPLDEAVFVEGDRADVPVIEGGFFALAGMPSLHVSGLLEVLCGCVDDA
jgi:hypothetical protein